MSDHSLKKIIVIDPAVERPEIDAFNNLVDLSPFACHYHLPVIRGMVTLDNESLEDCAGVVLFGSYANVDQDPEWQPALWDWFQSVFERRIPTLGICYGHQFFAHFFGAEVGMLHPDESKILGVETVEISSEQPIFRSLKGPMVASHQQGVKTVPPSMQIFAHRTGQSTPFIEGLIHGEFPLVTLQVHPEAMLNFSKDLVLSPEDIQHGHLVLSEFLEFTRVYQQSPTWI